MKEAIALVITTLILIIAVTGCGEKGNSKGQDASGGGAIVVTIRAEVLEIISDRALLVEVTEPAQMLLFSKGENVLLPGAVVTVLYGEDIPWISDVINNMIDIGSIIEFGRGITVGVADFLQEPFEVRGRYNIRILDENGNNIFERGF